MVTFWRATPTHLSKTHTASTVGASEENLGYFESIPPEKLAQGTFLPEI